MPNLLRHANRAGRTCIARVGCILLLLAAFAPIPATAASPREAEAQRAQRDNETQRAQRESEAQRAQRESEAQRALRDAERLSNEQLAARKEAAERAARAADEALRLAQERVEAAARLRRAEAATAEVAGRIDALAQRRRDAEQRVQMHANAIQPLLPLIERLSMYPAETMLTVPVPPETALRGLLVLQGLSRQIEAETEALRRDQADVDAAVAELLREAPRMSEAVAAQKREAEALDRQIEAAHQEAAAAEAQANDAASQAAAAAGRMDTLRSALAAIEAQRRAEEAKAREEAARAERQKRLAEAQAAREREAAAAHPSGADTIANGAGPRGQLQPPVIGVVVKNWGEQTEAGPANGLSYHAPPGARVISPCGGRVVFAQAFRSYGLLLIIDCGGGYHVVLSGFERLDVRLGQSLLAGEPVGTMPDWEPGTTARRPSLYVELRHDGSPVNPAPWLRPSS